MNRLSAAGFLLDIITLVHYVLDESYAAESFGGGNYAGNCNGAPCQNGAQCEGVARGYFCLCTVGWKGKNCDEASICRTDSCENGGRCDEVSPTTFKCHCLQGFVGDKCQTFNPCEPPPCSDHGDCRVDGTNPVCDCFLGYAGATCTDRVPCETLPCQNNGVCHDNADGTYDCQCPPPFFGFTCDESPGCQPLNPCLNEGVCIEEFDNNYSCDCKDNYTGKNCEVSLFCNSMPCLNEATCLQQGSAGFFCTCHKGYHGATCADHVCTMNDCQNEARCVPDNNATDAYICKCQPGYAGDLCEEEATTCAARPCLNDAECTDIEPKGYKCQCLYGYTGPQCQTAPDVAGMQYDSNLGIALVVILSSVGSVGLIALGVCAYMTRREMLKITKQEKQYMTTAKGGFAKVCTAMGRVCKICVFCDTKSSDKTEAGEEGQALADYPYDDYEDDPAYSSTKKSRRSKSSRGVSYSAERPRKKSRKERRISKRHASMAYHMDPSLPRHSSKVAISYTARDGQMASNDWLEYQHAGSGDSSQISLERKLSPSDQTSSTVQYGAIYSNNALTATIAEDKLPFRSSDMRIHPLHRSSQH